MAGKHEGDSTFGLQDFFRDVVRSFVPTAYPELAARPASSSAFYLLGVAFLVTALLLPPAYLVQDAALAAERAYVERAIPEVTIQDGKASFDGEQPYVHDEDLNGRRRVVIVDTTGQTTELPRTCNEGILITDASIVHRFGERTATVPLPNTSEPTTARRLFLDDLERNRWIIFAMLSGERFFFSVLILFPLALLAAAIGLLSDLMSTAGRRPFTAWFSISTHAATPMAFTAASVHAARTLTQFYLLLGLPLLVFALLVALGGGASRRAEVERSEAREAGAQRPKGRRRK